MSKVEMNDITVSISARNCKPCNAAGKTSAQKVIELLPLLKQSHTDS